MKVTDQIQPNPYNYTSWGPKPNSSCRENASGEQRVTVMSRSWAILTLY